MKLFKLSTLLVLGLVSVSLTSCSNDSIDDIDLDDQEFTEAPTIKLYSGIRNDKAFDGSGNLLYGSDIDLFHDGYNERYSVIAFNSAEELENAQLRGYIRKERMVGQDEFPDVEFVYGPFVEGGQPNVGPQKLSDNFSTIDWDTQSLIIITRWCTDLSKDLLWCSGKINVKGENVTIALDVQTFSFVYAGLATTRLGIAVVVDKANVKAENTHVRLNITDYGIHTKTKESEVVWINK